MCGGGNPLSVVTNAIEDVASGVGDVVGGAVDFVTEHPLESALLAAGVYYAPEIGAYLSSDGAVLGATEAEAAANAGLTSELPAGYAGYTAPTVTDLGTVAGSTEGISSGTSLADLANAPDAIDIGGGWNPATNSSALPVAGADAFAADNIDVGGGWNPAGGVNGVSYVDPATAAAAAATGTTLSAAGDYGATTTPGATIIGGGGTGGGGNVGGVGGGGGGGTGGNPNLSDVLTATSLASLLSGVLGSNAANSAAAQQADAARYASNQQMAMFNTINQQQAPYRAAGYGALSNLGSLGTGQYQKYDANGNPIGTDTGSGYLQHQFDATDLAKGLAPNYDFMLQQGQMANQRAANVGGGALSGNTLQGLQRYTQDYAGNAYQNAFNNYQTQRNNIYNTLAGIAGIGQTGQNATNTAAQNATNAATQLGVGSAAAQAAGTIGSTNAYTGAINNVLNNYTLASLLNQGGRVA